jgi:hypothetical protein
MYRLVAVVTGVDNCDGDNACKKEIHWLLNVRKEAINSKWPLG